MATLPVQKDERMKGHRHMNDPYTFIFFVLIFGAITAAIAQRRHLGSPVGWFVFGALLFIVALPMAIFSKPGLPQAPPGMRAVKCPRCNAVQNIPATQPEYECWQCKAANRLWEPQPVKSAARPAAPQKPTVAPPKPEGESSKVRCHHCQHVQVVPRDQLTFVCEQCNTKLKRRAGDSAERKSTT
ncbi:hypothetical protein [Mycobacterium sp. UM_CSW]|uniref:hypothetical protein n=1 Tax=Mycobacterium sp. UM_CSW TaxID=1370119 RepID=UPI001267C512|nr:hypothetical protein [Mycobacterium sp. UM_CSW]